MPLSDAAKNEIRNAIRIVKSDKTYTEVSGIVERALAKHARPASEDDVDELEVEEAPVTPAAPAGAPAPPKVRKAVPPVVETPPTKKSAWWGEIETE